MAKSDNLTKNDTMSLSTRMTKNDVRFISAARLILDLPLNKFARELGEDLPTVQKLEILGSNVDNKLYNNALRLLLGRGAGMSALIRAARGLLNQTAQKLAENADVSAVNYRRFEEINFSHREAIARRGSLARVLAYLASENILFITAEKGMGVCKRNLAPELNLEF